MHTFTLNCMPMWKIAVLMFLVSSHSVMNYMNHINYVNEGDLRWGGYNKVYIYICKQIKISVYSTLTPDLFIFQMPCNVLYYYCIIINKSY